MDDSLCLRFFLRPTETLHRRYEALRAYFVERRPLKNIAQQTGYRYNTLRDLISDFRFQCREDCVPPFRHPAPGAAAPRPLWCHAPRPGAARLSLYKAHRPDREQPRTAAAQHAG